MSGFSIDQQWRQQLVSPVAVLLGGRSSEREVSLQSGEAILSALQNSGIAAEAVDTKEDDWLLTVGKNFKHVFIALHGGDGEDGTVQGALQNIGVSYTGSSVAACALSMDKVRTKYMWKGMDFPSPEFCVLADQTDWQNVCNSFGKVVVKPATEGSSIGMAIVDTADELKSAYLNAKKYCGTVMAEQWIEGEEYTVSILGDRILPAIRLQTNNVFYDYEAKYLSDQTQYFIPCGLDVVVEKKLQALALQAFESVGGSGWGRVDFMSDKNGNFYLLEVNTVPGMTSHSLVPMAAKAEGISFEQLVEEILRLSVIEHKG